METPSYVQGKQQYLTRLHYEWSQAESSQREALCALARHEASTIEFELLPGAVRSCGALQGERFPDKARFIGCEG